MLDCNDAKDVINQLQTETFLCGENMIVTNNYIVIKKSNKITSDKVRAALKEMKGENDV